MIIVTLGGIKIVIPDFIIYPWENSKTECMKRIALTMTEVLEEEINPAEIKFVQPDIILFVQK